MVKLSEHEVQRWSQDSVSPLKKSENITVSTSQKLLLGRLKKITERGSMI